MSFFYANKMNEHIRKWNAKNRDNMIALLLTISLKARFLNTILTLEGISCFLVFLLNLSSDIFPFLYW